MFLLNKENKTVSVYFVLCNETNCISKNYINGPKVSNKNKSLSIGTRTGKKKKKKTKRNEKERERKLVTADNKVIL